MRISLPRMMKNSRNRLTARRRWLAVLATLGLLTATRTEAQVTIANYDVPSPLMYPAYNGSNNGGTGGITFAVRNYNSNAILLTGVSIYQVAVPNTYTLWYSATSLTGPATVTTANGWTQIATSSAMTAPTNALAAPFTNLTFLIPGNTTYRFAMQGTSTVPYSGSAAIQPDSFVVSGVALYTSGNTLGLSAGPVGYGGPFPTPGNSPRAFTGSITWIPATPCAGMPVAVTNQPAYIASCSGTITNFNAYGSTLGTGLNYKWQDSSSSAGWQDIAGATFMNYSTNPITTPTKYRFIAECTNSGLSDTSNVTLIDIPDPNYVAMPYVQNFESWVNSCATTDKPDTFWTQTWVTGDLAWRRNDQGASAWVNNPTLGGYTPAASSGTYSARFHSYKPMTGNMTGSMLLHVNTTGGPVGSQAISYDVINLFSSAGLDSFKLYYSVDSGATYSQIDAVGVTNGWQPRLINFTGGSPKTIFRFEGKSAFGSLTDIGIDNIKVLNPCTGAVTGGTITPAGPIYTCLGNEHIFTSVGATLAGSLVYEWQESADGINWTTAIGQNVSSLQFTTAPLTHNTYYRVKVVCGNTNDSAFSTPVRCILPLPKFAGVPYAQGFESWISLCNTNDKPDSSWTQDFYTGEDSWRRNDQGTTAAWSNVTGAYTPASKSGTYSARFHTFSSTTPGSMKLHMDMSGVAGTKGLTYFVNNSSGNDSLSVYMSTDSGATYSLVDAVTSPTNGWYPRTVSLNTNSNRTIIKFEGSAIGGSGSSDIGLDDVIINGPCSGAPVAGVIAPAGPMVACAGDRYIFNVTGSTFAGGIVYEWQDSTALHPFQAVTNGSGASTLQYTTSMVNQTTAYRLKVTCGTQSSFTAPVRIYVSVPPKVAAFPYEQDFETWNSICSITDAPSDSSWRNLPATGLTSWRRYDQGASAGWTSLTLGNYNPIASSGSYSARFHSYSASGATAPKDGDMNLYINLAAGSATKKIIYDYINPVTTGTDSMSVWLSNDGGNSFTYLGSNYNGVSSWTTSTLSFTSNSPDAVIRFRAGADNACCHADMGIDNVYVVEDCNGMPNAGKPFTIPANPCKNKPHQLKLGNYIPAAGQTYQWQDSSSVTTGWRNLGTAGTNPGYTHNAPAGTPDTVYYRCQVTCVATSQTAISVVDTVVFDPFYLCYCDVAISTAPTGNPWLDSITVDNVLTTVTNTEIRAANPGVNVATQYFKHPMTPLTTDTLAMTDSAKIRLRMSGTNNKSVGVWVDLNRNGVFDASEFKLLGTNVGTGANIILNNSYYIPDSSQRGYTGMRIMVANGAPLSTLACGNTGFSAGEVEDLVVFIENPPCSSPPNPGVASVNKMKTCPAYPVHLQVAGYQQQVTGLSFRWQISGDGANWSYVPFGTQDTASANIQFPVNYFRCEVRCYGGQATYTNIVKVTAHPDYACYCYSAAADNTDSSDIGIFKFGKFAMTSPGGTHLLNPKAKEIYTDYIEAGPVEAWADSTYDVSVFHILGRSTHTDGKVTLFIDYNRNGRYDVPQERVFTGYTTAANFYLTGTVKIPVNIMVGPTGMRLVLNENVNPNIPSDEGCGAYPNGETEDYLINLKSNLPATGITEIDGVSAFSLYPNPTTGQVNIYFKAQRSEKMNLVVTNVAGQVVMEESLEVKQGDFYKTFDLTQAAKGVYFVQLSSGTGSMVRKVVVQ